MVNYYQSNIAACDKLLQSKYRRSTCSSIMRGVTFLCALFLGYFALKNQTWIGWVSFTFAISAFTIFLTYSSHVNKKIAHLQALKKVYEQELAGIVHQQFPNANGAEFCDPAHPYANDLDVFGERSLFHLLNRCHTFNGHAYLAEQLKHPPADVALVYLRQEAIKDLQSHHKDLVFETLAFLSAKQQQQPSSGENILLWLRQPDKFSLPKAMQVAVRAAPLLNVVFLAAALYNPYFYVALLPLFIIRRRYSKRIKAIKNGLNCIINDITSFDIYGKTLAGATFQSSWLQRVRQPVVGYGKLTRQLHRMLSIFDMGSNFFGFLINVFFLSDLKAAVKVEEWKKKNREVALQLIEHICEWEMLTSLAVLSMNHPTFAFPKILGEESSTVVAAKEVGHPLILAEKRVSNDVIISKNDFFVITGANMAGKSVFLRTLGVNLLLARIGAPVCAASFQCAPVQLFTSMRTADNLDTGTSYFYAEALRFKKMLDFIAATKNMLLIIDELFRGTNSDDRLKASLAFIRKLTGYNAISALIATHDLGVTILEKEYPEKIKNYCFECFNCDSQILFDYKLRRGATKSSNACLLLQKMQIIS